MDKNTTCCFTGHRSIPLAERARIESDTERAVRGLYARGYRSFVCGGAVGYDQLCAELILRLKKEYPDMRLELVLPCGDQDKMFSPASKAAYRKTIELADSVEVLNESYTKYCMHQRNRAMADRSSVCVAYCTKPTGGTAYTVDYARNKGLEIIRI